MVLGLTRILTGQYSLPRIQQAGAPGATARVTSMANFSLIGLLLKVHFDFLEKNEVAQK